MVKVAEEGAPDGTAAGICTNLHNARRHSLILLKPWRRDHIIYEEVLYVPLRAIFDEGALRLIHKILHYLREVCAYPCLCHPSQLLRGIAWVKVALRQNVAVTLHPGWLGLFDGVVLNAVTILVGDPPLDHIERAGELLVAERHVDVLFGHLKHAVRVLEGGPHINGSSRRGSCPGYFEQIPMVNNSAYMVFE